MTYGGAGAIFPLLALAFLALPITLLWVFKGSGKKQNRHIIGFGQLAIFVVSIVLFFTQVELLQIIGLFVAFIVLLSMLLTPLIFKKRV